MSEYGAKTSRIEWGVPLLWAQRYPGWPDSLRNYLARARAEGLTVITVIPEASRHHIGLVATRPGEPVEYEGGY